MKKNIHPKYNKNATIRENLFELLKMPIIIEKSNVKKKVYEII